ncbi:Transcriptional regulator PadR-like family protein [Terribacillus saccharophilus]|uniref:Transcriptional regulator PadR-like family protein n=1 Tax=Terribacillus saccharophilus TaxID=361277 RepID=A0AAX2EC42_9BACI|nr:Transcriptional regulator PadR-like family protein [Terribacillus saccharophilus]
MLSKKVKDLLPLTHTTYYILMVLKEPLHGYGIMKEVEIISEGSVRLGPGTLYGVLRKLEKLKLICQVDQQDTKKTYQLTGVGGELLIAEYERLRKLVEISEKQLGGK